ncbi:MAG: transposase [Anaerolineaceae bacterium]
MPQRQPNRLRDYDYGSNGAYFITICTKDRENIFWQPGLAAKNSGGMFPLSEEGRIVNQSILNIPLIYPDVSVEKFVIMPNHIHMILCIHNIGKTRKTSISTVVNQMKGYVSKNIGQSIWQKLFHDHVIRNEDEYQKIWDYIDCNPIEWGNDIYHMPDQ